MARWNLTGQAGYIDRSSMLLLFYLGRTSNNTLETLLQRVFSSQLTFSQSLVHSVSLASSRLQLPFPLQDRHAVLLCLMPQCAKAKGEQQRNRKVPRLKKRRPWFVLAAAVACKSLLAFLALAVCEYYSVVIFYSCVPKEGLTVTVTASKLPGLLRRGKISQSATKPCAVCFSNQKI